MRSAPVLLWLRRELRLADNPALAAAMAAGPVVPVFVLDEESAGAWADGGASRWWLHHSLVALGADLRASGNALVLRRGRFAEEIPKLVAETGSVAVHAGLAVEPWARRAMAELEQLLDVPLHQHLTTLMLAPGTLRTGAGTPYGVYGAFARAAQARDLAAPALPAPTAIAGVAGVASDDLAAWRLLPTAPDWATGFAWMPGEAGAHARLAEFLADGLAGYARRRDRPGEAGTSALSPHLAFGEISPCAVWRQAMARPAGEGRARFLGELLWREFCANLLWFNPGLPEAPMRPKFAAMPWRDDPAGLAAWQRGRTGIPIVDAGMRELWRTGWMHNRVRMIVASFLAKHLLIRWQEGEAWFWDTLVDADLAQNSANWQWVAGSGADAAPYFRVFNPVLQGRKFDPQGDYVRRFVPELAGLPDRFVHAPWEAPEALRAGLRYPPPIVDLAAGRARALAAFAALGAEPI